MIDVTIIPQIVDVMNSEVSSVITCERHDPAITVVIIDTMNKPSADKNLWTYKPSADKNLWTV
jgi:hypothetical protein